MAYVAYLYCLAISDILSNISFQYQVLINIYILGKLEQFLYVIKEKSNSITNYTIQKDNMQCINKAHD